MTPSPCGPPSIISIDTKEDKDKEMLHFAEQEITDRTQTAIAIIVGIFGILILFTDIERVNHMGVQTMLVLSVVYWGLAFTGVIFLIQRQTFIVLKEDLVRQLNPIYNETMKEISARRF
jgi:hypothetical protein